ncbi:hypothetical protein VB711_02625 [Cronbergia sp. UHCC 0137]|uniref:hypothetical protein n=1 Tax=Cronbergia sp. UHCC 0137 TaxID=3110239 RepID=UPI002B217A2F|nr:hypothetical protein [Cronbergia sp. UHCC 0137]MEA5616738.1 hypothetical protein [Cronbergia sp. UHCC 0137]
MSNYNYCYNCSPEEHIIYQHLLELVRTESPSSMLERFRNLFINGTNYAEPNILLTLYKVVGSDKAPQEFKFFLNRCCHILINHWHMQPQSHYAIFKLIGLFDFLPISSRAGSIRHREIRRLHELVKLFTQGEQYSILQRFTQVVTQSQDSNTSTDGKPLVALIRRYPYLYEHCLMGEYSTFEQQETVRNFQKDVQKKFEIDLSQYVTYKVRNSRNLRTFGTSDSSQVLRPVNNPTLLSDNDLDMTLRQFIGKSSSGYTHHELAQQFLSYTNQSPNFGAFKDDLYEYLISSVDAQYGKRQFNKRLYTHLQNTLPQANSQPPSDFLIVRTCSQLLNFLVVHSQASPQHFNFLDLISNQGTVMTIGLVLKVVLICRKVKPYLENRFAILFNHYESNNTSAIGWLVGSLEQLNVALSIHFGQLDLSFLKQLS